MNKGVFYNPETGQSKKIDLNGFIIFDSLEGIAQKDEINMAKFKDEAAKLINNKTYIGSDGKAHLIKNMINEHLTNAALKVIRESGEVQKPTETVDEFLVRFSIKNSVFKDLYEEIKNRGL